MSLIPQSVENRIVRLEESIGYIEEKIALLEEALAPAEVDEEESLMLHKAMMKKAVLDKNQEWVIPKEKKEDVNSN